MDKAIEKFFDMLPRPIIILSVVLFGLAWTVKELRQYTSYLDVFKDKVFFLPSIFLVILLVGYYTTHFIRDNRSTKFSDKERGIIISEFEGDIKSRVQIHTFESVKSSIYENPNLSDVSVKKAKRGIHDHKDASNLCKTNNAALCVWGTFIPPAAIHYSLSSPSASREARAMVMTFPNIEVVTKQITEFVENTPPTAGATQAQIKYLEKRLDEQFSINAKNAALIQGLVEQVNSLQTEAFGQAKYNLELAEIKKLEKQRKRIALVVGISQYSSIPSLRFPSSDARAMAHLITKIWGDNAEVYLLENATNQGLLKAMDDIAAKADTNDQVWLYYSGHAAKGSDGTTFILPSDGNPRFFSTSAISMNQIGDWFNKLKSKQAIMFADACYSGAFGRFSTKSNPSSSLEMIRQASGRVVITAGGEFDFAVEDENLGHGVFTNYLLKGLTGDADIDNDGLITTQELFEFISASLSKNNSTKGFRQNPTMFAETNGSFVLSMK